MTHRPWVVVTDYPSWPSPYFAQLHHHAPPELQMTFRPDLAPWPATPPGVVNLHRLKRLYRDPGDTRTEHLAAAMLARLWQLRADGWAVVWTVHNLLPVDGPPQEADRVAADGVLDLADTVITHTRADAATLRRRTRARIVVAGWGGLPAPDRHPDPAIADLAHWLADTPASVLAFGNMTAYKQLPATVAAILDRTCRMRVLVAGPARDAVTLHSLQQVWREHPDRLRIHPDRIAPTQAEHLYTSATAALCSYRSDGEFGFFTQVLHPSSVGTARGFATPVIAPALPAVVEMTTGCRRFLYPADYGPVGAADAAARVERTAPGRGRAAGQDRSATRWRRLARTYRDLARTIAEGRL